MVPNLMDASLSSFVSPDFYSGFLSYVHSPAFYSGFLSYVHSLGILCRQKSGEVILTASLSWSFRGIISRFLILSPVP